MTDRTQSEAGSTHIIRYALELGLLWIDGDGRDQVREALDALDILEAQLASIGAGGVQPLRSVQEGCKLVPLEPTPEMLAALMSPGEAEVLASSPSETFALMLMDRSGIRERYSAMLAASPTPPAERQIKKPNVVLELPDGDDRVAKVFFSEMKGDTLHLCITVTEQAAPKAAPGEPSDASDTLSKVCDLFQIGKLARTESTILINVENTIRFSNMLNAVEHDMFPQPDLPEDDDPYAEMDENPPAPNKWGAKDEADYVAQFRAALLARGFATPQQEAQEPYGYVFVEQYAPTVGSELKTTREVFTKAKPDRQCLALYTAPRPAPAPLSDEREAFESTWEKLYGKKPVLWDTAFKEAKMDVPTHSAGKYFYRDAQAAWKAWQARAALAARGGE